MRTRSLLAVLALTLAALPLAAQQDTRPGIAVLPFTNGGSYGQEKEVFDALERGIAGMMISELSANPALRLVERENIQKLVDEQNLGAQGRLDPQTAARIGRLVGAKYVIVGTFIDWYGDFRLDARLINVETSEVMKTANERQRRSEIFKTLQTVTTRLIQGTALPQLPREQAQRQVPADAMTYYSRGLLYRDRGDTQKAAEMFQRAVDAFPQYAEAQAELQRVRRT